jgi:hypothetical protein
MSKVKITFEISKEDLFYALKQAGNVFDLEVKEDIKLEELEETLNFDISNHFRSTLSEFLEEGLNNDLYTEYFN